MSGERGGQGIGPSLPIQLPENVLRVFLSQKAIPHNARVPAQSPFHKQLTEKRKYGRMCHMLAAMKNSQSFSMICRKPHMASSICLRAIIFQNSAGTLWTL
jgi:hypothetical protein